MTLKILCSHENGKAPMRDFNGVHIGYWCYKCHKTWFSIKKEELPRHKNITEKPMTRTQELLKKMRELGFDEGADKLESLNEEWKKNGLDEY